MPLSKLILRRALAFYQPNSKDLQKPNFCVGYFERIINKNFATTSKMGKNHGGWRQPMCDPEGCSTVWEAVGGGDPPPSEEGGGHPPPSLTQTQHPFRQAPSKRANTQS